MCYFAFFWLLKICIVNVLIAHHVEIKINLNRTKPLSRYKFSDSNLST